MRSVEDFLKEKEEEAWHNRNVYSKNYPMDQPRAGFEQEFERSVRDCEIIRKLMELVQNEK